MFKTFSRLLENWFRPSYRLSRVPEKPERLKRHRIYLLGEGNDSWAAVLVCPCGCQKEIWLNLLEHADGRPTWRVEEREGAKAHIYPSIWRQTGCHSHFSIRDGRIIWASKS